MNINIIAIYLNELATLKCSLLKQRMHYQISISCLIYLAWERETLACPPFPK